MQITDEMIRPDMIPDHNLFKDILESLPIGVTVLDSKGRIVTINKQQELFSRMKRDKVLGQVYHKTSTGFFKNKSYADKYWKLIRNKVPYFQIFDDLAPQLNGKKVSGYSYGAPLSSGFGYILLHGTSEELKFNKSAMDYLSSQLEESLLFLNNLINTSPNAVITSNSEGAINYINAAGIKLFQYKKEEILSKHVSILFSHPSSVFYDEGMNRTSPIELSCLKKGGEIFPVRLQLSHFKSGDYIVKLYIISDISIEKQMKISLNDRLAFEQVVTELSAKFINLPTHLLDNEITSGLKCLNNFLNIDRSSLSQLTEDGKSLIVTHSYGYTEKPLLLGEDLAQHLPDYTKMMQKGEILVYERMLEEIPKSSQHLKEHALKEGIKSHLGLPLSVGDTVVGVLGFTSLRQYRKWPEEMVSRLTALSNIFANCLMRKKAQQSIDDQLKFEMFISELSASFINLPADEIGNQITMGLERISKTLHIDRSILAPIDKKTKVVFVSHSWTAKGAEFTDKMTAEQFPWICDQISKGNLISYCQIDELPKEAVVDRENVQKFNVKSYLSIPLRVGGTVLGSLSLHSVFNEIKWPDSLVNRVKLIGEIFANALLRQWNEENLKRAFLEIKQLNEQIEAERNYLREEIKLEHNIKDIVGNSRALQYVLFKVEQVAPTDTTVLILGETGTGKELISRAVHEASLRRDKPLVKVNCATLPSHIIESELFGHEKGAFTGAHARQIGRFELANDATLFLDEIGELPLELQAKLLRVLQDGEFERLGSPRTVKVNVRIIAATNRDLETEVKNGRFRKDLWFRLNIFPITLPPLRKRIEDVPDLVNWFTKKFSKKLGKSISRVRQEDMESMMKYDWPGNVRELANFIERAVINTDGALLVLPEKLQGKLNLDVPVGPKRTMMEMERDYIIEVLDSVRWKIEGAGGAAEILDLHPSTLRGRMRRFDICK